MMITNYLQKYLITLTLYTHISLTKNFYNITIYFYFIKIIEISRILLIVIAKQYRISYWYSCVLNKIK